VIDVHRGKTTLVVMRVPECKLLAAMRRAERVVDVKDLQLARLHCRAELIKQSRRQPRCLGLGAFSRREMVDCDASGAPLSGQRPTATFIKSKDHAAAGRGRWHPRSRKFLRPTDGRSKGSSVSLLMAAVTEG
jgi:hypothetical protein